MRHTSKRRNAVGSGPIFVLPAQPVVPPIRPSAPEPSARAQLTFGRWGTAGASSSSKSSVNAMMT